MGREGPLKYDPSPTGVDPGFSLAVLCSFPPSIRLEQKTEISRHRFHHYLCRLPLNEARQLAEKAIDSNDSFDKRLYPCTGQHNYNGGFQYIHIAQQLWTHRHSIPDEKTAKEDAALQLAKDELVLKCGMDPTMLNSCTVSTDYSLDQQNRRLSLPFLLHFL